MEESSVNGGALGEAAQGFGSLTCPTAESRQANHKRMVEARMRWRGRLRTRDREVLK
jgi:hypothetical protein